MLVFSHSFIVTFASRFYFLYLMFALFNVRSLLILTLGDSRTCRAV